jgi:para-nitrobenzyl esterase
MNTSEKPNVVRNVFSFVYLICLGLPAICAVVAGSPRTVVASGAIVTDQGPLKGISTAGENLYLGIPYAAAPVGNLRWRSPQPPAHFMGLFQATRFGNPCVQTNGIGGTFGSEDCLSLNVYVPTVPQPAHGFPVMVWIHGGSFTFGAGLDYDPTPLVEKGGVIVITINYRLGYLGFFAHPALDTEGHPAGNYGLMDQQFALKWVRRNIGAFGGNRNRVTIFGQSAGGFSVYAHLASPTAAALFERAIAESGAYVSFEGHFPFTDYDAGIVSLAAGESTGSSRSVNFPGVPSGNDVATSVGCASPATASCLRAVPAATLVLAEPGGVNPFVDGTLLTQPPGEAIGSGQFNQVPVISGSTHDENRFSVALAELSSGTPLTAAGYPGAVYSFLGLTGPPPDNGFADSVIALYPLNADPTSPSIELGALSDADFVCGARNADLLLSQYVPTYAYEFHDETAPPFFPVSFPQGDSHFIEVQYLFDLEAFGITPTFTADQQALSNTMIGYWTQFAKTGNPNSTGAPTWSQYSAGGSFESLVAPAPVPQSDASFDTDHHCSGFWDTL